MFADKSSEVDGLHVKFFTSQWNLVKIDIVLEIQEFLSLGNIFNSFSCTAITLVPKVPTPTMVKNYRLIVCCNTSYKIITKVLTNRMEGVINTIISPFQSVFVEVRSIFDNILFGRELLNCYTRKGLSPRCALQVELRKSYDSVEWVFLKSMLVELGFPQKFIG